MTPKALDAVDVNIAAGELIVAMVDPQMFVKAHIDQAVIAAPAASGLCESRWQCQPCLGWWPAKRL